MKFSGAYPGLFLGGAQNPIFPFFTYARRGAQAPLDMPLILSFVSEVDIHPKLFSQEHDYKMVNKKKKKMMDSTYRSKQL